MRFDLFGDWDNLYVGLPVESKALAGYLLLVLYLAILIFAFYRQRREILRLSAAKATGWLALILVSAILSNTLEFHLFGSWFPPAQGASGEPIGHDLPLLSHVPILLAAGSLGLIPATLVALVGGLVRALFETHRAFQMFEVALFGLGASYLIRQEYQGRFFGALRQPLAASLLAALATWLASIPSLWVFTPGDPLPTFIRVWAFLVADLPAVLSQATLAGLLLQTVFWIRPASKPVSVARRTPPYGRSLNMRLVAFVLPMILLFVTSLFYAVNVTAIGIARRQIISQASRDASNVSERIPFFFQTGQSLISEFAADRELLSDDPELRRDRLERALRTVAFFDQLALLNGDGEVLAIYPPPPSSEPTLSDQEQKLIERVAHAEATQISSVHQSPKNTFVISFVAPVYSSNELGAYLVGRADTDRNPMMRGIVSNLQWTLGAGVGFIVDERGRVVAHPDQSVLFSKWDTNSARRRAFPAPQGEAYEDYDSSGQRRLVYHLPVQGYPWATVVTVPHEVILAQAAEISMPLVIILVLMGVVASAILPLITSRLTQPVQELARAAGRIAQGELDSQVDISGEDEVGRLGIAFEQMRVGLKERLEELSLLLDISQAVSVSLDLERGLMPILEGAIQAADALSARILLVNASGQLEKAIVGGPVLDRTRIQLDTASRQVIASGEPVLIQDVSQMPELVDPALLAAGLAATVGLPLRIKGQVRGVMWVDHAVPRHFDRSEMDFLSTLAGQAAVVAENARLFETVENERGRLAAILASTTDAILVVDRAQRLLLANPAAESTFGIHSDHAKERSLPEIIASEQLLELLGQSVTTGRAVIGEIPLLDERTLYANASPVVDGDGQTLGCVAVMRDITHLKQLDAMKSDFVATVSHDLRAPLTFIRGYTTMIPMAGEVTDKQQEFINKITSGIAQMTELIDDLLDIGKIEAGIDVEMAPCRLDEIIRGVMASLRGQAEAAQLTLEATLPDHLPPIVGDQTLLRHAITNLVDNAIKYTLSPGSVIIRAEVRNNLVVISIQDTGIGIAPADQLRLFEKFYRVKRRETIKIKGSGLGLAIVKSIADRHHGRVWVNSKPDQGSTFYLALPKEQPVKDKTNSTLRGRT